MRSLHARYIHLRMPHLYIMKGSSLYVVMVFQKLEPEAVGPPKCNYQKKKEMPKGRKDPKNGKHRKSKVSKGTFEMVDEWMDENLIIAAEIST